MKVLCCVPLGFILKFAGSVYTSRVVDWHCSEDHPSALAIITVIAEIIPRRDQCNY